jgi:glutaminase
VKYKDSFSGNLANYIPELTKADPALFGIALATADGRIYEVGDSEELFTIQSISKPLVYGLALEDNGSDEVLRRVGVEPTGEAFNSIVMDEVNNRPFNPMVNAGAIATTSLIKGNGAEERFARILDMFGRYAGRKLTVDQDVFQSERATGHRNRAIAYLQLNSGMISEPVTEHLDLYFQQCSILVSARDLAMMAATLANSGINPVTGEQAVAAEHVKSVLSIMASCGMYDYSGEWVYRVGLPAKSGVGGGIIAVLPGQFGFGVYSPLLDAHGNSHRGIEVCRELSQRFQLHVYDTQFVSDNIVRRSYAGGAVTSKRERADREWEVLNAAGHRILVYELQGGLYFATVEQLLRRIADDADKASFIVLDCHRIGRADHSALTLLRDMNRSLIETGKRLLLAGLTDRIKADWLALQDHDDRRNVWFANVDEALEHCENSLIVEVDPTALAKDKLVPLSEMDIFRRLTPEQIGKLQEYITQVDYASGDRIVREGEAADRLYMLASGTAVVNVALFDSKRIARRAAFGPGVAFGEFALFDGGTRVADVVAETPATCYELKFENMAKLEALDPALYNQILFALGRLLSDRLRRLTNEVRALA